MTLHGFFWWVAGGLFLVVSALMISCGLLAESADTAIQGLGGPPIPPGVKEKAHGIDSDIMEWLLYFLVGDKVLQRGTQVVGKLKKPKTEKQ